MVNLLLTEEEKAHFFFQTGFKIVEWNGNETKKRHQEHQKIHQHRWWSKVNRRILLIQPHHWWRWVQLRIEHLLIDRCFLLFFFFSTYVLSAYVYSSSSFFFSFFFVANKANVNQNLSSIGFLNIKILNNNERISIISSNNSYNGWWNKINTISKRNLSNNFSVKMNVFFSCEINSENNRWLMNHFIVKIEVKAKWLDSCVGIQLIILE